MSRVKKREKKATVERRVARRRMKVKMNQPCLCEGRIRWDGIGEKRGGEGMLP